MGDVATTSVRGRRTSPTVMPMPLVEPPPPVDPYDHEDPFWQEVRATMERAQVAAGAPDMSTLSREEYERACAELDLSPMTDDECFSREIRERLHAPPRSEFRRNDLQAPRARAAGALCVGSATSGSNFAGSWAAASPVGCHASSMRSSAPKRASNRHPTRPYAPWPPTTSPAKRSRTFPSSTCSSQTSATWGSGEKSANDRPDHNARPKRTGSSIDILLANSYDDLGGSGETQLRSLIAFPMTPRCYPRFPVPSGTQRARCKS